MSAHTPGPWKAEWNPMYRQAMIHHGQGPTAHRVASCAADNPFGHLPVMVTNENAQANARLIAAAPALVEALQEAAEYIDDHVDVVDGAYGYQVPNRAMSLMNRINEALRTAGVE